MAMVEVKGHEPGAALAGRPWPSTGIDDLLRAGTPAPNARRSDRNSDSGVEPVRTQQRAARAPARRGAAAFGLKFTLRPRKHTAGNLRQAARRRPPLIRARTARVCAPRSAPNATRG